nr:hypothetical protein [Tanacetum cinerariifolium]
MKVVVLRRKQEAAGGGGCCGVTSGSGVDGGGDDGSGVVARWSWLKWRWGGAWGVVAVAVDRGDSGGVAASGVE